MMTPERFIHYKTGHDRIDTDHWDLFKMMDSVISHLTRGLYDEAINKIKILLPEFAEHVRLENTLMETAKYPYYDFHKIDHDAMLGQINHLKGILESSQRISVHNIDLLENLFLAHVDHYDSQMISHIAANPNTAHFLYN
jgi:hemerythrin-like metal-binding protein